MSNICRTSYSSAKKWTLKSLEENYLRTGDSKGIEAALQKDPLDIRYMTRIQGDRDIALMAVQVNGLARFWLSPELLEDPEVRDTAERNLPAQFSENAPKSSPKHRIFSARVEEIEEIKEMSISDEHHYLELVWESCSSFLRDSHVVLFDGKHLIPYAIKDQDIKNKLREVVPPTAGHFFSGEEQNVMGHGFTEDNTDQAMVMNYDHNIPFKRAKTCIEGGNCFLFLSNGEQKAIVGELSLYLSWLALQEQGVFQGMDFEAQIEVTKEWIAEELEIPLHRIVFVPQTKFHIDMELFVTPRGEVVLHDDQKTLEFLEEIQTKGLTETEKRLGDGYVETARRRIEAFAKIQQMRKELLEEQGIEVRSMPGIFEAPVFESALNYCNGIFVKEKRKEGVTFVTTGPSIKEEQVFHSRFGALFQQLNPGIELRGISGVSNLVAKHSGGIRCLTVESSLSCQRGW